MTLQRKMPTENAIRTYWASALWEKKSFDSATEFMENGICFACGMSKEGELLHRCHIVTRCEGGSDGVDNIHMLCWLCHKDSEFLLGDKYWTWFWERTPEDTYASGAARAGFNIGTGIKKMCEDVALWDNGKVPFGFRLLHQGSKRLIEDEDEQEVISIVSELRQMGVSLRQIKDRLVKS